MARRVQRPLHRTFGIKPHRRRLALELSEEITWNCHSLMLIPGGVARKVRSERAELGREFYVQPR